MFYNAKRIEIQWGFLMESGRAVLASDLRVACHDLPRSLRAAASCQEENGEETAYAARINQATYRCGKAHSEDENMKFYSDSLLRTLQL